MRDYFKGPEKRLTYPWSKALKVVNVPGLQTAELARPMAVTPARK